MKRLTLIICVLFFSRAYSFNIDQLWRRRGRFHYHYNCADRDTAYTKYRGNLFPKILYNKIFRWWDRDGKEFPLIFRYNEIWGKYI